MAGSDAGGEGTTPEDGEVFQRKQARKPPSPPRRRMRKGKGKGSRATKGDILLEAMRQAEPDEKAQDLIDWERLRNNEGMARFFPGSPGNSVDLIEIAEEVLRTYQEGVGDPVKDLAEMMKFLKIPAKFPRKAKNLMPLVGRNLFADDRAHLTAAAFLMLLSWVQRKRFQILDIMMGGNKDGKMTRLQQAIEEFLIGSESLWDFSKKSQDE